MSELKHLSPTSMSLWLKDRGEFYLKYVVREGDRFPQTKEMAVGSAFDSYVKSYCHEKLFGSGHPESARYQFENLFESSVEVHNRDLARVDGKRVFDDYTRLGALSDLMLELINSDGEPRFEFTAGVGGTIECSVPNDRIGVPGPGTVEVRFTGKPDAMWFRGGLTVIHDWKVNGYYSQWGASPKPGYLLLRPGGGAHKDVIMMKESGFSYNCSGGLDEEWERQLGTYCLLTGASAVSLDQICYRKGECRVAEHRYMMPDRVLDGIRCLAGEIWHRVSVDHVFGDLSVSESRDKCALIRARGEALKSDTSVNGDFMRQMAARNRRAW